MQSLLSVFSSPLPSETAMADPAPAVEAAVEAGILSRERRIPLRTLPTPKRELLAQRALQNTRDPTALFSHPLSFSPSLSHLDMKNSAPRLRRERYRQKVHGPQGKVPAEHRRGAQAHGRGEDGEGGFFCWHRKNSEILSSVFFALLLFSGARVRSSVELRQTSTTSRSK